MDLRELRMRVERHIRRLELIPPGGEGTCLAPRCAAAPPPHHVLRQPLPRPEPLPLLGALDPRARETLLARAVQDGRPRLPRRVEHALLELLATRAGTKHADLGGGIRAVREYDRLSLEQGPVRFGPWTI